MPVGAEATSHTASLAGSDAAFDAALRSYRVERVDTTDRFLDLTYAVSRARLPRGNRLGIVTISGGAGVLMTDAAAAEGLEVPPLGIAAQRRLLAANPLGSPRNPVDVIGQALNNMPWAGPRPHPDCRPRFRGRDPRHQLHGPRLPGAELHSITRRSERRRAGIRTDPRRADPCRPDPGPARLRRRRCPPERTYPGRSRRTSAPDRPCSE